MMEINGINLDVACSQLVSEIEAVVPVKFTQWDNHYYSSVLKKNEDGSPREADIQFKLPLEIPKIAHELLHMKVGLTMGDNGCMLTIPGKSFWYRIFVKHGIVAQILNLCEHVIFFPYYLDMGYKEEDSFEHEEISDSLLTAYDEISQSGIKTNGQYDNTKVECFISLVFSFDFYPNERRFRRELKVLKRIDNSLYSIIHELRNSCSNLAIVEDNRAILQEIYLNFATRLNRWLENIPIICIR